MVNIVGFASVHWCQGDNCSPGTTHNIKKVPAGVLVPTAYGVGVKCFCVSESSSGNPIQIGMDYYCPLETGFQIWGIPVKDLKELMEAAAIGFDRNYTRKGLRKFLPEMVCFKTLERTSERGILLWKGRSVHQAERIAELSRENEMLHREIDTLNSQIRILLRD